MTPRTSSPVDGNGRGDATRPIAVAFLAGLAVVGGFADAGDGGASAQGITWEAQQKLQLGPPRAPTARRVAGGVRICWRPPAARKGPPPGVDATILHYRVERWAGNGPRRTIGTTRGLCFVDRGAQAVRAGHVIVAVTRSGHESETSDLVAPLD